MSNDFTANYPVTGTINETMDTVEKTISPREAKRAGILLMNRVLEGGRLPSHAESANADYTAILPKTKWQKVRSKLASALLF
jgi:hypothetical protein